MTRTGKVYRRAALALCAALLASGGTAQEQPKAVPAGDSWSDIDPSTLALMLRQEPLSKAANEIRSEVQKDWNTVLDGNGGFAFLELADDKGILIWKGEIPASVQESIERARQIAPVEIKAAPHSHAELSTEFQRLVDFVDATSPDGYPYLGVLMNQDGLRVVVAAGVDTAAAHANLPAVAVPVEVVPGEPMQYTSRCNDWAPWFGGARFESWRYNSLRGRCTLGFGVRIGTREYLLTAAHCAT